MILAMDDDDDDDGRRNRSSLGGMWVNATNTRPPSFAAQKTARKASIKWGVSDYADDVGGPSSSSSELSSESTRVNHATR